MNYWEASAAYERSRENPVAGERGDELQTGRTDDWSGHTWVWCTDAEGREGWVAEEVLDVEDGTAVLRQPFDAIELSVAEGERVEGEEVLAGWLWATNADGDTGWVPLDVLEER